MLDCLTVRQVKKCYPEISKLHSPNNIVFFSLFFKGRFQMKPKCKSCTYCAQNMKTISKKYPFDDYDVIYEWPLVCVIYQLKHCPFNVVWILDYENLPNKALF